MRARWGTIDRQDERRHRWRHGLLALWLLLALAGAAPGIALGDPGPAPQPLGVTFANTIPIMLVPGDRADPYPSTITVSGVGSQLTRVTVTLDDLTNRQLASLTILLVSPTGGAVLLLGGCNPTGGVVERTITFDDEGVRQPRNRPFPLDDRVAPSACGAQPRLAAPAPTPIDENTLDALTGTDPNGTWSLYIQAFDRASYGHLEGWSLTVEATGPDQPGATPTPVVPEAPPALLFGSGLLLLGLFGWRRRPR